MPLDNLPDILVIPSRDDLIKQFLADVTFRAPTVAVGQGLTPNIDAAVNADSVLPLYGESVRQGEAIDLDGLEGAALEQEAIDLGLPGRLPAVGASGFAIVSASVGGGSAPLGLIAKHPVTGTKYEVTSARVYQDGELIPLVGVTTGPQTNLEPGVVLQWVSPPIGFNLFATVFEDANGNGLTGGRDEETDEEIRARIREARSNPAASGNDAAYQQTMKATPGVAVLAAFTYPAIQGAGTTAACFLVRPGSLGASRVPNAAQIALVRGNTIGQMPRDDSAAFCDVTEVPTDVILGIDWAQGNAKWTDGVPWPTYAGSIAYEVQASPAPTATVFKVKTTAVSPDVPVVGQTIALFDRTNLVFVPKRITAISVIGLGEYTLTTDTGAGSDTTFVPAAGDRPSPWSDSLNQIPDLVATYFETLGPGEQVNLFLADFFDEGYRQRRNPPSPQFWPNEISERILISILQLASVDGVTVVEPTLPAITPYGTIGVASNLLTLGNLAVLPKP